uniref:Major sperm protein n=1 Tax=Wuchereria bancrofti TaxID=6293 RepID=A0A1I8ES82_WUCBA
MSYLQCTPAMIQVPCTGGTTTHILEAIGTERLAFKVKLKQKHYNLYRVSPPLGFVKPGLKKELFLRRLPGKPGKTKLVVEYIASPEGYDPRKPFVEGADVGVLDIRVRAYSDRRIPDKVPKIMGKLVTKAGQKFVPTPGYDDLKLETEINDLYKDKESILSTEHEILKAKEGKGKAEKKKEKDESLTTTDEDGKIFASGIIFWKLFLKLLKIIRIFLNKKGKKNGAPIQVVIPNLWKGLKVGEMQKTNELKEVLELVTNENKRLEEIIKQMMQEITFLRESLLSTVMKLANAVASGTSTKSGAEAISAAHIAASAAIGKSRSGSNIGGTIISDGAKTATSVSGITSPVASGAGGTKISTVASISSVPSPVASGTSGAKISTATGVSGITSPATGVPSAIKSPIPVTAGGGGAYDTKSPAPSDVSAVHGAKSTISIGAISQTGAGAEVEQYLSSMLAGGGHTIGAKESDEGNTVAGGGLKEFSLYFAGASPGALTSAYMSAPSRGTSKAKDMNFAFGNTADQLDRSGRPDSPGGSSTGGGGGPAYRATSVYLLNN